MKWSWPSKNVNVREADGMILGLKSFDFHMFDVPYLNKV